MDDISRLTEMVIEQRPTGDALYAVLAFAALCLVVAALMHRRKTKRNAQLKAEYDRALEAARVGVPDLTSEAAQPLVVPQVQGRAIRPLQPVERKRFAVEWEAVQLSFVDSPTKAVIAAEALIADVMLERGYPLDDYDSLSDAVATFFPAAAAGFRAAHALTSVRRSGVGHGEHLRKAFLQQRALFHELIDNATALDLTSLSSRTTSA